MPRWIQIEADDLDTARAAELIDALREEALREDPPQENPVPEIIQDVVTEVRNCIGMCDATPLDADPAKVPGNLKRLVIDKIIRVAQQRLQMPFSDEQKKEEEIYQRRLEQLTQCKWPVLDPDNPVPSQVNSPAPSAEVVSGRGRKMTDESIDGL